MDPRDRISDDSAETPVPCRCDPLRWATQVALLVLLSPALFVVLAVGGIGIAIVALVRAVRRIASLLGACGALYTAGILRRRPAGHAPHRRP